MTNGDKIRRMTDTQLAELVDIVAAGVLGDKICRDCAARYGSCLAKETEYEKCRYHGPEGAVKWLGEEVLSWG